MAIEDRILKGKLKIIKQGNGYVSVIIGQSQLKPNTNPKEYKNYSEFITIFNQRPSQYTPNPIAYADLLLANFKDGDDIIIIASPSNKKTDVNGQVSYETQFAVKQIFSSITNGINIKQNNYNNARPQQHNYNNTPQQNNYNNAPQPQQAQERRAYTNQGNQSNQTTMQNVKPNNNYDNGQDFEEDIPF